MTMRDRADLSAAVMERQPVLESPVDPSEFFSNGPNRFSPGYRLHRRRFRVIDTRWVVQSSGH